MKNVDSTKLQVLLVPGYMKLDREKGCMVPTYPPTWPGRKDAPLGPIVSLASALSDSFDADEPNYRWYRDGRCYLMQCAPHRLRPGAHEGPRLAGKAWEAAPITMQLLLTDIDAADKKATGFSSAAWWEAQSSAISQFLLSHPGAFFASSRGGLRIYQVLEEFFIIDSQAKADEWKARYVSWVKHVGGFPWVGASHGGADETKDWTRLQRIPHDTRDGVLQQLPTLGDPARVGVVELPDPAPDLKPRTALRPYTGPTQKARVKRFVLERLAAILPKQGEGVHDAAFALGGIMSAAEWSTEDCVGFIDTTFQVAGIRREDIPRTAQLSVETARRGGKTYGWKRFVDLCNGDMTAINLACGTLRAHIPGLDRDAQWHDALDGAEGTRD
jgi:hypothetical protein